ncbi:16S rRNA (cytosine(1402)-N(4))-methyltransferase RsmH [Candidatus Pelagibacter sp.]|nr:16S rRNA (cytosine(1402)-N(4))-methyltransferase RsmH [Candidatus Pelagibacter sp.]
MNATINLEKHFPVLLNELVSIISPLYGGTFIDCTFGAGGYSKKILENNLNKVIALDRDISVQRIATKFQTNYKKRFKFYNLKFSDINKIQENNIKAIIFDLGYSLNQISDLNRGLSFKSKGKLDMRMGLNDFSCDEVISKMSQQSLFKIFKYFGEEKYAKPISKKIVQVREHKKIESENLVEIIENIKKKNSGKNKSTKIFQALRIFVNKEITELIYGLINAYNILPIGGIIAVVTFHSIEDKIVKFFFKEYSEIKNSSRYLPKNNLVKKYFDLIKKKPIIPSSSELKINPPSRSAKLRFAFKLENGCDFKKFINNFNYLKDIENLNFDA